MTLGCSGTYVLQLVAKHVQQADLLDFEKVFGTSVLVKI